MNDFLAIIYECVENREVLISTHGYEELSNDSLTVSEVLNGVGNAEVLEYYPDFGKGPCILVLQFDSGNMPVHVVWGVHRGSERPAVLITAYRPDPSKWDNNRRRIRNEENDN